LLSPLHIKLGITKYSVKATDQTGTVFRYLKEKFPEIRATNITEGVFISLRIRKLFRDKQFNQTLNCNEKRAVNDFQLLATYFRGNNMAENKN
jgi:hypothetical protein